jgi:hypothetical protein
MLDELEISCAGKKKMKEGNEAIMDILWTTM